MGIDHRIAADPGRFIGTEVIITGKLDGPTCCSTRAEFALNVCKSVWNGHVQTGEHWTRNCKQLVYATADESMPELPAMPE